MLEPAIGAGGISALRIRDRKRWQARRRHDPDLLGHLGRRQSQNFRCNGSSIYVDAAFRFYAPLLTSRALTDKNVTVLNLTAAATYVQDGRTPTGFTRYSNGILHCDSRSEPISCEHSRPSYRRPHRVGRAVDLHQHDLLLEHADYGCTSLWCIAQGRAYPSYLLAHGQAPPCAQLVYCRNVDDFVRFARPSDFILRAGCGRW